MKETSLQALHDDDDIDDEYEYEVIKINVWSNLNCIFLIRFGPPNVEVEISESSLQHYNDQKSKTSFYSINCPLSLYYYIALMKFSFLQCKKNSIINITQIPKEFMLNILDENFRG